MQSKQPRYDLPKAAPEPLRHIQRFVNTIDLSHEREWLIEWLEEQGLESPTDAELAHARVVREAVRELLFANSGHVGPGDRAGVTGAEALSAAADAAMLTIDFDSSSIVARAPDLDGVLGVVAVICFETMADGSWQRLKCCRNRDCRWAFYDYSRNRSAAWCSMQICGNRTKTRAYRRRAHAD